MMETLAPILIGCLVVWAFIGLIWNNHPGDKRHTDAVKLSQPSPPPVKPPATKTPQWADANVALVKDKLTDLPGVYKEDVDVMTTSAQIVRMATELGVPSVEIREMLEGFEQQVEAMPTKPPETNDECPECGKMFAMVDDYLCPDCRAQA